MNNKISGKTTYIFAFILFAFLFTGNVNAVTRISCCGDYCETHPLSVQPAFGFCLSHFGPDFFLRQIPGNTNVWECYADFNQSELLGTCVGINVSCPDPVGEQAEPFDFLTGGECDCSNPDYEARNLPDAVPPQVGCFPINDGPEEDDPDKDDGCDDEDEGDSVGNPCNVATGNKHQSETDISGSLSFVRSYNSSNLFDLGLGKGWRSNYQKRLIISDDSSSLTLASGTGRGEPWSKQSSNWVGDADTDFIITEDASGFTVTKQNSDVEQYDTSGNLVSETDTQGKTTTYEYNTNNQLVTVTNHFGQSLSFTYDANGHLESVTDASGAVYTYEYDANDNLTAVLYPDTTPNDNSDNPSKIYHYENVGYPNHLTGITDENGDRYATYAYDVEGKAISTEHAPTTNTVGQERFELDYQE